VLQALNAVMDAQERDAEPDDVTAVTSTTEDRFAQRRADALTTMAETTLRHGPGAPPLGTSPPIAILARSRQLTGLKQPSR